MKSTTLHNSYETNLPPLARSAVAIAVASAFLLASTGAVAQTTVINSNQTGPVTANNLTVEAQSGVSSGTPNYFGTTVTGDVEGAGGVGAFASNVLTLKHASTENASNKSYARIDGDISNFGTINLDYSHSSGTLNGGAYTAPITIGLGNINTGADPNAAVKLNILSHRTDTNQTDASKYFKLTSNITGSGGFEVGLPYYNNPTYNPTLILAGNNNDYTGLTTVRNGTLQIGDGTANGQNERLTAAATAFSFEEDNDIHLVGDHAAVRFTLPTNRTFTYNGVISSEGHSVEERAVMIHGTNGSKMILTEDQTYTGETYIGSSSVTTDTIEVVIGNGIDEKGSLGTGRVDVQRYATLTVDRPDDLLIWENEFVLNGTFNKKGATTLILSGEVSAATNSVINIDAGGTLQLGNGENSFSTMSLAQIVFGNDATLRINYDISSSDPGNDYRVTIGRAANANSTSGAGQIILDGSRTVIMNGGINHTGGTIVNGGVLRIGDRATTQDNNISGTLGNVVLKGGTTLEFANNQNTNYSFSGDYSGEGNLRMEGYNTASKTTLSGNLDYTGTTTVERGTLELSGTASLASTSALILQNGTTFTDSTGGSGQTLKRLDVYGQPTYNGDFSATNLNFFIPDSMGAGATLLTVNGNASIGGTVNVVVAGNSTPLQMGDSVTLLQTTGANTLTVGSINSSSLGYGPTSGTQGALIGYSFDIESNPGAAGTLKAIVAGAQLRPEGKSLSEGYLSGTAALTRSSDFIASHGIAAARAQLARTYGADDDGKDIPEKGLWGSGVQPFYAYSAGRLKHNSGSYVNTEGYNFIAGAVAGFRTSTGQAIAGAFFEYGKGEYDTYNSFASGKVTGDGNTYHRGFGFFGRVDVKDGYYVEGSLRRGKVDTRYKSDYLRDAFGTRAAYTSKTAYTGAHLGAGKVWPLKGISEKLSLDTYGQALWTRQDADTVTLSTGERVSFGSVSSERLKAGARARYDFTSRAAGYVGFAYDHEFAAKVNAKLTDFNGAKIDTPKLSGGTGVVELGFLVTPSADSPYSADLGIQAYTGKREGVVGSLRFNYFF